jgi:hypothetical protein
MSDKNPSYVTLHAALAEHLDSNQMEALMHLLKDAHISERLQTARGIKTHLAEVMDQVQEGVPQLIKRVNDEFPVLVISLETVAEALHPTRGESLWEAMHGREPVKAVDLPSLKRLPRERLKLPMALTQPTEA